MTVAGTAKPISLPTLVTIDNKLKVIYPLDMARPRTSALVRFLNRRILDPNSGCHLWIGPLNKITGYASFQIDPKDHRAKGARSMGAHRAAWILFRGPIPDGLFVCHKCDTKHCVNPDHLFLGDAKANMRDAAAKGRMNWKPNAAPRRLPCGELHNQAKVTEHIVKIIRNSKASGVALAKLYGITPTQISRIRLRKVWVHI